MASVTCYPKAEVLAQHLAEYENGLCTDESLYLCMAVSAAIANLPCNPLPGKKGTFLGDVEWAIQTYLKEENFAKLYVSKKFLTQATETVAKKLQELFGQSL